MAHSTEDEALSVIRAFDNLPVERQVAIFRDLSPKARMDLLTTVTHPERIVRRMAPEEVLVTIKQVGEADSLPLIALTTGKQFRYILDLELWRKEEIDVEAAGRWFEILSRIGEGKVLQFSQVSDPELVLTVMSKFVRVKARNPDIDIMEQMDSLPIFTMDDTFFIEFLSPRWEDPVRTVLEAIFEWNHTFYFRIMEELCWGVPTESEQAALHWRQSRLADHGFPDFDEAFEIYRYLHREGVAAASSMPIDRHDASPTDRDPTDGYDEDMLLRYPMRLLEDRTLFRECLDNVQDDEEQDRLSVQLAHLANKVMIADNLDPAAMEALQSGLSKVGGYINIALEEACAGDVSRGAALVCANHMEVLFRRGYSVILDLRREARDLLSEAGAKHEDLGHPLSGLLQGLFHKRPFFAAAYLGTGKARDFSSMADIRTIRDILHKADLQQGWEAI